MQQIHQADEQKILLGWLKEQGAAYSRPLWLLSLSAIVIFGLQLLLFWFLSASAQILLVDDAALPASILTRLIIIVVLLVIVERFRLQRVERLENHLYSQLQAKLLSQLSKKQLALVRQHSTYFWQQLWLSHIPAIGRFNVQYLVQQRFTMFVPLLILACVFPLNWLVGLSLLFSLPVVPLFMIIVGKGAANLHRKHFKALSRMGSIFVDRLKSLEMLRIFNAHQAQAEVLDIAGEGVNKRTMKVVGIAFLSSSVLDFFSTLAVALVAVFVGFNLLGEFTVGGLLNLHSGLFILLAAPLCFAELKQLGRLYHLRAEAIAAAAEMMPIINPPEELVQSTVEVVDGNHFKAIVWQSFNIKQPAISAAKIVLEKGDWVFLQGASGSGKTCFLEGIMGQRNSSHYFKHAALIAQNAVILPTTVRENLNLGNNHSDDDLRKALAQVELSEWLNQQPNGLDTVLNEQVQMSGGQKQRLSLARVFLSDAKVVLLDEPTAHLTDEQHFRLSQVISKVLSHKTVIWASHKALPEQWFNRHWQMKDGVLTTTQEIKEQATPEDKP